MSSFWFRLPLGSAVALLLAGAVASAGPELKVDPAHTSASFSVKHLTLTTVTGTIAVKSADVTLGDGNALTQADAVLDLTTIDTHESDRDADLKSEHWFDVAKYPEMTFKSTKIEPGSGNTMTIAGDLTFHGITKPVILTATYGGTVKDPRGRTHVGYSATGTIDRAQWNLGAGYPAFVVGNNVTLTIQLEAIEGDAPPS